MVDINNLMFLAANTATETASGSGMSSVMNNNMSISEKITLSLQMMAIGLGTVFAVLIILWLLLTLFRVVFYDIPNKRKPVTVDGEEDESDELAGSGDQLPVIEEVTEFEEFDNSEEIAAVISAAVAAMLSVSNIDETADSEPNTAFKVVSFKRVNNRSTAWNQK